MGGFDTAIVGGGLAGLTAAHRIVEMAPEHKLILLEESSRFGGVIQTDIERIHGKDVVVELGADSIFSSWPDAENLVQRLGLAHEVIRTQESARRAFLLHGGALKHLPVGWTSVGPSDLMGLLKSDVLSFRGKARILLEPLIKHHAGEQSIADFFTARMGREAFETLIQPLIGGIYAGKPEELSMTAALGEWVEAVHKHGSLLRALKAQSEAQHRGARYSLFFNFKRGSQTLIEGLTTHLRDRSLPIILQSSVREVQRSGHQWILTTSQNQSYAARNLILAIPASTAVNLIKNIDHQLASQLSSIPYRSSASINFLWPRTSVRSTLQAAGYVIPRTNQKILQACTWSSQKYAGRAPESETLIRAYCTAEAYDRYDDEELVSRAEQELRQVLNITEPAYWHRMRRFHKLMPEYTLGHIPRVDQIETLAHRMPNLGLCGAAYRGSGIPKVIRNAEQCAEKIVSTQHD